MYLLKQWISLRVWVAAASVFVSLAVAGNAAAQAQGNSGPVKLGVVIPKDLVRGERASGSVVLNPEDYSGVPGLRVTITQLPRTGNGAPSLPDFQIQINTAPMQPANLPFTFTASDRLDVRLRPAGAADGPAVPLSIPLSPSSGSLVLPRDFTTSPIAQFGLPAVIHGPLGGDCTQTSIRIGGRAAPLIAESEHALFYWLPEITPGPALVELQDGAVRSRLKTWALGLQMSADRLKLMKGESTAFHVVVLGAETIPEEAWSGGGGVPELEDLDTIHKFLPDFRPPGPSNPGVLLLTIENKSPGIVTMGQGERVALTFTRSSAGKLEYHGHLLSKQAGAFNVGAVLMPFLHEQKGESVGQGENAQVAGNTTPLVGRGNDTGSSSGKTTTPGGSNTPDRSTTTTPGGTPKTPVDRTGGAGSTPTDGNHPSGPTTRPPGATGRPPGTTERPQPPNTTDGHTPTTPRTTPEVPKVPTSPSGTPTTHKDERQNDCPQRGKGCVALVIDFSKDYKFEFDMSTVAERFTQAGCDTDYIAPAFKDVPTPGIFSTPTAQEIKAAQDYNQAQWDTINAAISRHREKVARGVEVAIELTNGHGGDAAAALPCGDVEPADWRGSYIRRDDFHQGNYQAANKNVCSWFTADLSCYGGLTPKVVDELENLTTATCNAASAIACGNHAGWEADGSMSSATSTATCSNGSVWWQGSYVKDALDAEIARRAAGQNSNYSQFIQQLHSKTVESTTSRYTDRGYTKDHPPIHGRGGYGEKSSDQE